MSRIKNIYQILGVVLFTMLIVGLFQIIIYKPHKTHAGTIQATGVNQGDLVQFLTNTVTTVNSIRSALLGNWPLNQADLAVGSNAARVSHATNVMSLGGVSYALSANATGDSVTAGQYGAWNMYANASTVYASFQGTAATSAAAVALVSTAGTSGYVRLGHFVHMDDNEAFVPGTSILNSSDRVALYYDGGTMFEQITASALSLSI